MAKRSYFDEVLEMADTWDKVFSSAFITPSFDSKWLRGTACCVGSGGSLALAKLWQLIHEQHGLGLAKVVTPFEFSNSSIFPELVVIFSASGKNHDILEVFRVAKKNNCKVLIFTKTKNSPLTRLAKTHSNDTYILNPDVSTPSDGFLAVNSMIAISSLILLLEQSLFGMNYKYSMSPVNSAIQDHKKESIKLRTGTFQIIASDWGYPAGIDFEARLAESGIGHCFLTDPRNFGHGRFIWLENKKPSTSVLIFYTPSSKAFIKRFHRVLPNNITTVLIESPYDYLLGAVYCIVRSVLIIRDLAKKLKLNPGKPNVPEWGRKLHGLKYNSKSTTQSPLTYPALSDSFNRIVMDLDGTIVNTEDRFKPIKNEIVIEIERLLGEGLRLGIATGRGGSAIELFKSQLNKKFHSFIIIGLYNGTGLMKLNGSLDVSREVWPIRHDLRKYLLANHLAESDFKLSLTQISIRNIRKSQVTEIISGVFDHLGQYAKFIKFQESGHSLDILPHWATKLSVIQAISESSSDKILCIGDQGQVGGNDEELLSWQPSISVGKLRPASNLCFWIGHNSGLRESNGLLAVLRAIYKDGDLFKIDSALKKTNET